VSEFIEIEIGGLSASALENGCWIDADNNAVHVNVLGVPATALLLTSA